MHSKKADYSRTLARLVFNAGAVKANFFQGGVDFFQRLFAEIGNAQQVGTGCAEQVLHGENAFLLQTVRGANGQADLSGAEAKAFLAISGVLF